MKQKQRLTCSKKRKEKRKNPNKNKKELKEQQTTKTIVCAFTLSFVPGGSSFLKKKTHSENILLSNLLEWCFTVKWYNRKMNYKLYCFWHIRLHLLALDELQRSMVTTTHVPKRRYGDFLMQFLMPIEKDKGLCTALFTDTRHAQRSWHQVHCTSPLLLHKAAMGLCSEATVETAPRSPTHSTLTFSWQDSSKGKHKLPLTSSKINPKIPAWSQHNLHIREGFI